MTSRRWRRGNYFLRAGKRCAPPCSLGACLRRSRIFQHYLRLIFFLTPGNGIDMTGATLSRNCPRGINLASCYWLPMPMGCLSVLFSTPGAGGEARKDHVFPCQTIKERPIRVILSLRLCAALPLVFASPGPDMPPLFLPRETGWMKAVRFSALMRMELLPFLRRMRARRAVSA